MSQSIDDFYNASRERYRANRERWQAAADAQGVPAENIQVRELAAEHAAHQAEQQQRDAAAAAALSSVTLVQPPEGAHPSNRVVYAELNRQRQAAALAQAEADARDPSRLNQLASDRQAAWEHAYRAQHGMWPSIEEMDKAGVLAPWLREKWAADDAKAAADKKR